MTGDDLALTGRLDAEVRERTRPGPAGARLSRTARTRFTPWISAGHGAVNAMPADCKIPW